MDALNKCYGMNNTISVATNQKKQTQASASGSVKGNGNPEENIIVLHDNYDDECYRQNEGDREVDGNNNDDNDGRYNDYVDVRSPSADSLNQLIDSVTGGHKVKVHRMNSSRTSKSIASLGNATAPPRIPSYPKQNEKQNPNPKHTGKQHNHKESSGSSAFSPRDADANVLSSSATNCTGTRTRTSISTGKTANTTSGFAPPTPIATNGLCATRSSASASAAHAVGDSSGNVPASTANSATSNWSQQAPNPSPSAAAVAVAEQQNRPNDGNIGLSKVRSDISMFSADDDTSSFVTGIASEYTPSSMLLSPPIVFKQKIMKKIEQEKQRRVQHQQQQQLYPESPDAANSNKGTRLGGFDVSDTIPEESLFTDDRYSYYDKDTNGTNSFSLANMFGFGKKETNSKLKPVGFNKKRYLQKKILEKEEALANDGVATSGVINAAGSMVSMLSRSIFPSWLASSKDKYQHNGTMVSQLSADYNVNESGNDMPGTGPAGSNYVQYDQYMKSKQAENAAAAAADGTNLIEVNDEILNTRSVDTKDTGTTVFYAAHGWSIDKAGTIKPLTPTKGIFGDIASKIPSGRCWKIRSCLCSNASIYLVLFLLTIVGLFYGAVEKFHLIDNPFRVNWDIELSVAFVGNAYFYVNDIPRLMETISSGHIYQQSCIHAGGSLSDLWMTGNGMFKLWSTEDAIITNKYDPTKSYNASDDDNGNNNNGDGNYVTVYDYGMCTVAQLIQGYDEYISFGNPSGQYYNDGLNPCMIDQYYAKFIDDQKAHIIPSSWDYIILADQTKRMAISDARNVSIQVLAEGYGPLIAASTGSPIPVIVDTHAFWSDSSNMTGLSDIPTFTSLIYDGIADYIDVLKQVLPRRQYPIVAPIGLAFLTVWEENYDLWETLFIDDKIHPSIRGSYLFGIVLYATLFGHLPDPAIVRSNSGDSSSDSASLQYLFQGARKLLGNSNNGASSSASSSSSLSLDEIDYLLNVARRVALRGYVPKSFYRYQPTAATTSSSSSTSSDTDSTSSDNDGYRLLLQEHHRVRIENHQRQRREQQRRKTTR